jgi:hypothetical protein
MPPSMPLHSIQLYQLLVPPLSALEALHSNIWLFGNCKHSSTMASSGLADQFWNLFIYFLQCLEMRVMNNEVMALSNLRFPWKGSCNPYLVLSLDIHVLHVLNLFPCNVEPLAYASFKIIHFEINFKILTYINLLF